MNTARTPLFLMANLGSEVNKMISAKEKNDPEMLTSAINKARPIFSDLKMIPEMKKNKEIDILFDVIDDLGQKSSKYKISSQHLKSYFYPFATRLLGIYLLHIKKTAELLARQLKLGNIYITANAKLFHGLT